MTSSQCFLNSSTMGTRVCCFRVAISAKTGLSSTLRRTMKPTMISTKLSRNGMRQPHSTKAAPGEITPDIRAEDAGGQEHAQGDAELRERAEQAAPGPGRVLDSHQYGAAPFAPGRDALQDAQE